MDELLSPAINYDLKLPGIVMGSEARTPKQIASGGRGPLTSQGGGGDSRRRRHRKVAATATVVC